jgi:sugar O-acyltransferase (sialic acid O-acetyltransferase NeuD family)
VRTANSGRKKLLLIGSSGHAAVLVDAIESTGKYQIAGYLDDGAEPGAVHRGYSVLGSVQNLRAICETQRIGEVVIAIGDNWQRRRMRAKLLEDHAKLKFPAVLHPSAVLAKTLLIGQGAVILANAHAGPGTRIAEFCILNTGSSLDHDCEMRAFSSLAPGVFTGGHVVIGECSAIGVGASISDKISVGNHAVVGTGAVVVRNIPDLVVAYGNPAKAQRSRSEGEAYMGLGHS